MGNMKHKWIITKVFILSENEIESDEFEELINDNKIKIPFIEIKDWYGDRIFTTFKNTAKTMIEYNMIDLSSFKNAEKIYDFKTIVETEVNVPIHDFYVNKFILL